MSFDPSSARLVEETPKPRFNSETARLAEPKRAPFNPANAVAVDDLPNFTIMDFLRQEEGLTETSPMTPGVAGANAKTIQPLSEPPPLGAQEIEETLMTPLVEMPEKVKEGIARTVAAVAAPVLAPLLGRRTQEAAQGLADVAAGLPEAVLSPGGLAIAAAQAVPGLNVAVDAALAAGMVKSGAQKLGEASVTGDVRLGAQGVAETVLAGAAAAGAGKAAAKLPINHEAVLPGATETFKEVVGEPASGERATVEEPNAIGIEEAAAPVRDVLRSDEGGTQAPSGVPESVNEGGAGVRGDENQAPATEEAVRGLELIPENTEPIPELSRFEYHPGDFKRGLPVYSHPGARTELARKFGIPTEVGEGPPGARENYRLFVNQEGRPIALWRERQPEVGAQVREQATAEAPKEAEVAPNAAPEPSITGIKNARVDAQRAARGLDPLMEPERKADPVLWQEAMDKIEADPELPTRLTDDLFERPRPMTDVETVIMERELVRLSNDLNEARAKGIEAGDAVEKAKKAGDRLAEEEAAARAAEFEAEAQRMSDALVRVEQAVGRQETPGGPGAGTLMGRALRARQLLMREDYSYAGLEKAARQAKGFAPLDAQELLEVRKTAEEFKKLSEDLERRLKEQEQATARAETQRDLANARAIAAKTEATAARKVAKAVDKVGAFLDARADAARERLKGKLLSLSPEDLKDIAEIAAANLYHVGVDFAKWSAKMVEEVGEKVKPHLQTLWEDAQRIVKEATASKTGAKRTPAPQDAAAAVRDRLQARIADYERRIANNDFEPRWQRKPPIDSEEITEARYHLEQIKREWHEKMFELKMARRTAGQKLYGGAVESVNAMRSVLTSADLSAVLRQGLFIGVSHPLRASKSIWPMLRAFADPVKAFEVEQKIMKRRNYPLYRASGLYLAEHGIALSRMEEAYMSRLASKIPLVGRMVKASERAYITYLNKLRADSFDAMAATLGRGGRITPEQARILSNYINVATGRGTLSVANRIGTDLNTFFFAPKFVASRFQMLLGQPLYYGVISGKAPVVARGAGRARVMVATEYGRILIGAAVVYGLGMAAGAEVETDSRSGDFGKLRFGNTRIDPMAGVLQVTVLLKHITSGETKILKSGRIAPLRPSPGKKLRYGSQTEWDVISRFARMKFAPAPGLIVDALSGEDVVGNTVTPGSLATKALVPISIQDILTVMQDEGLEKGAAAGVLSIFGAGVQNFDAMRKRD